MALLHTMSPSKLPSKPSKLAPPPRSGPLTKPAKVCSVRKARLSTNSYFQPSQLTMPGEDKNPVIEQFRFYCETHFSNKLPDSDDSEIQKRISYTKEQKLAAISYAITTWVANKDGSMELISKYCACLNLNITPAMLRDWIKSEDVISIMHRGVRKNRVYTGCQELGLEASLVELFMQARKAGRKITRRWFVRQSQQIYGQLYPDRVVKNVGKKTEYIGFSFSHGWFCGF